MTPQPSLSTPPSLVFTGMNNIIDGSNVPNIHGLGSDISHSPTTTGPAPEDAFDITAAHHPTGSTFFSHPQTPLISPLDVLVSDDPFADPIGHAVAEYASGEPEDGTVAEGPGAGNTSDGSEAENALGDGIVDEQALEIMQAVVDAEVDRVSWSLGMFEEECRLVQGDVYGVLYAIARGCDGARDNNCYSAAAAAPARGRALQRLDDVSDCARESFEILVLSAQLLLLHQQHAAWNRYALLGEDLRNASALPSYASPGFDTSVASISTGSDVLDGVFAAFERAYQAVVHAVVAGMESIQRTNHHTVAQVDGAYDASADALDRATAAARASIDVLAAYARDAVLREFVAAQSGLAVGYRGALTGDGGH